MVVLDISPLGTLSFDLNCNLTFNAIYFEWSTLLLILVATIILIISVLFGRLDSFNGTGVKYSLGVIITVAGSILTVGLFYMFIPTVAIVIVDVASWVLGFMGVSILTL